MASILERISGSRTRPQAALTSAGQLDDLLRMMVANVSSTGLPVTHKRALEQGSFAAAVMAIALPVGQLPLQVFERSADGAARPAPNHWLARLVGTRGQPNPWQTSQGFRETGTLQAVTWGNFYAMKNTVRGRVGELLPLDPARVTVRQDDDWRISYAVQTAGGIRILQAEEVFHLAGPSLDGLRGLDRVAMNREAIGLALAQDEFAGTMFRHGTRLGGWLKHPKHLSEEAARRLKDSFEEAYGGVSNAHKTAILEEGMEFVPTSQTADDSQLLESRTSQRSVLAGSIGVPPHMIGDLSKATFSNIENQSLQFLLYTLLPWLVRWELALEGQLLGDAERERFYVKFNVKGLLRGDAKTQAQFYNQGIAGEWLNPNEARELEDLPPYPGGEVFGNRNIKPGAAGDNGGDGGQDPA